MYTTLTADGLGHMSCPLNFAISQSQNSSSALASGVTASISHQAWRVFSKPYKLLVINLVTGPMATDMDIIFPIMLARYLACSSLFCIACWSWTCRLFSFTCGTAILPYARSMLNPNQEHCCAGSQQHFEELTTRPPLFKSSCMALLAVKAACSPWTATIPSSRYSTICNPCCLQYFTRGLISLVKR